MTNGCFDIIHSGHVDYLKKSKNLGDILIVAINTDVSVRKLKGENRPINNLKNRIKVLIGDIKTTIKKENYLYSSI